MLMLMLWLELELAVWSRSYEKWVRGRAASAYAGTTHRDQEQTAMRVGLLGWDMWIVGTGQSECFP
jgi:hypothetical protein